jgi:hypothetical protein
VSAIYAPESGSPGLKSRSATAVADDAQNCCVSRGQGIPVIGERPWATADPGWAT